MSEGEKGVTFGAKDMAYRHTHNLTDPTLNQPRIVSSFHIHKSMCFMWRHRKHPRGHEPALLL